jgi:hypothetical protein
MHCRASNEPGLFGEYGSVAYDAEHDLVQCHLCGAWLKWVDNQHIIHRRGVNVEDYRRICGLSNTDSLMGASTRAKRRSLGLRKRNWPLRWVKAASEEGDGNPSPNVTRHSCGIRSRA